MGESAIEIWGIPAGKIAAAWPFVEPILSRHPADYFTTEDLKIELLARRQQLWIALEGKVVLGVLVSEIVRYPQATVLTVRSVAGRNVTRWGPAMRSVVSAWAVCQGCDRAEVFARAGWAKILKIKPHSVMLREEL